jgi:hypothetical protein
MERVLNLTLAMTFATGLVLIGCGDDDDSPKDAGGDAKDHDHDGDEHDDHGKDEDDAGSKEEMSFFVSSDTSKTGNLGGLSGADARCNKLAKAAGSKLKFAAYLSADKGDDDAVDAKDRIGKGPWYNVKGVLLAKDLDALHKLPSGNADLFLTEKGAKINGQWSGSPTPNEHDVLTGSTAEGTLREGFTCKSWTSEAMTDIAQVGHSDGLGPMMSSDPPFNSWNSSHENGGCNDTAPRGGAGHIYCFAVE